MEFVSWDDFPFPTFLWESRKKKKTWFQSPAARVYNYKPQNRDLGTYLLFFNSMATPSSDATMGSRYGTAEKPSEKYTGAHFCLGKAMNFHIC